MPVGGFRVSGLVVSRSSSRSESTPTLRSARCVIGVHHEIVACMIGVSHQSQGGLFANHSEQSGEP